MKRISVILCLVALGFAFSTAAQEPLGESLGEEGIGHEPNAVYGEVSAVDEGAGTITLLSYDYENEEEVDVTYVVSKGVELEGAGGLGEIEAGDWVDLNYHIDESGNKIADFIAVEREPDMEQEEVIEETEREGEEI